MTKQDSFSLSETSERLSSNILESTKAAKITSPKLPQISKKILKNTSNNLDKTINSVKNSLKKSSSSRISRKVKPTVKFSSIKKR